MPINYSLRLPALFVGLFMFAFGVQATVLTLPPVNVVTTSTYNDFQVQSLDLNNACLLAGDPRCMPGGPYPVKSSPGQIAGEAVILASPSGGQVQNFNGSPFANGALADNPFLTPSGSVSNFMMSSANQPAVSNLGVTGTWEIDIGLLNSYLKGNQLVFLYQNSQPGNNNTILYLWGQVNIINPVTQTSVACYELSTLTGCHPEPAPSPGNDSSYVGAPGVYCVSKVTGVAYQIDTATKNSCLTGDYFVNDNLGAADAEYAVFNSALDAANLAAWGKDGYIMSVNMAYDNNQGGAEQLWICDQCNLTGSTVTTTPEPGTLALMGIAILMMALRRKSGS